MVIRIAISVTFILCVSTISIAQPTISKIIAAEYFFDKDPGIGKGIRTKISIVDTITSFKDSASVSSLATGYHTLIVRVKNAEKKWSIFLNKIFYIGDKSTNEPNISKISAAEYFFDEDPGTGNGIPLSVGKADTLVNFEDSVTIPLLYGKDHALTVRVKNNAGAWSIFKSYTFSFLPTNLDRDGLLDYEEPKYGTNYKDFDTNDDGLADGVNVFTNSDALNTDTDGDGYSNRQETSKGTSPILKDTDGDGVSDRLDSFPLDYYRTKTPTKNLSDHTAPMIILNEPPL